MAAHSMLAVISGGEFLTIPAESTPKFGTIVSDHIRQAMRHDRDLLHKYYCMFSHSVCENINISCHLSSFSQPPAHLARLRRAQTDASRTAAPRSK